MPGLWDGKVVACAGLSIVREWMGVGYGKVGLRMRCGGFMSKEQESFDNGS